MTKNPIKDRKANELTFNSLFSDGSETPESIMVRVMHGQTTIMHKGKRRRITKDMQQAASMLLPYRLPRLNSIDATTRNVDMTHEEWIASMADEDGSTDD